MRDGSNRTENENENAEIPFLQSLPLAVGLFGFWVILSGKLDAFHLSIGALSALLVAYFSRRLFELEPAITTRGRDPFVDIPWIRLFAYIPWLAVQIASSSIQVAIIVLRPKMRLAPKLFRFDYPLPHPLARATLANSITLTPGTVTLDVRQDEYLVHALSQEAAESLENDAPGNMKERASRIFAKSS